MILSFRIHRVENRLLIELKANYGHLLNFFAQVDVFIGHFDDRLPVDREPMNVLSRPVNEVARNPSEHLIVQDRLIARLPVSEYKRTDAELVAGESSEADLENSIFH